MQKLNAVLKEISVNGAVSFPFIETDSVREETINVLSLDTRAHNGLKRNKIDTLGEVLDNIENGNLFKLRGLGNKSVNHIIYTLCAYQYAKLPTTEKQDKYLLKLIKLNTK